MDEQSKEEIILEKDADISPVEPPVEKDGDAPVEKNAEKPLPKPPFRERFSARWARNKQTVGKFAIVLTAVAFVSVGFWLLFSKLGLMSGEGLQNAVGGYGFLTYIIFLLLFIVQGILLIVIPGNTTLFVTTAFIIFGQRTFGDDGFWTALILCIIGNQINATILFWIGRTGGRKVMYWLLGKESVDKRLQLITDKGVKIVPGLLLIPFMPNDLLCMCCGASKMKYPHFLIMVVFFRSLEVLMFWSYQYAARFFWVGQTAQMQALFVNIVLIDAFLIAMYYRFFIKMFRKHVLRRKYAMVKSDHFFEVEVTGKTPAPQTASAAHVSSENGTGETPNP